MEEEDPTFPEYFRHLPTQPATNPSPKQRTQLKMSLPKNAIASLLLHSIKNYNLNQPAFLFQVVFSTCPNIS
jgi:hypothetical protein